MYINKEKGRIWGQWHVFKYLSIQSENQFLTTFLTVHLRFIQKLSTLFRHFNNILAQLKTVFQYWFFFIFNISMLESKPPKILYFPASLAAKFLQITKVLPVIGKQNFCMESKKISSRRRIKTSNLHFLLSFFATILK